MGVEKVLQSINGKYIQTLDYSTDPTHFKFFINKQANEIVFYHVVFLSNLDYFTNNIKEVNFKIIQFVQSNFFYKVVRLRSELNDKHVNDNLMIFINKIQIKSVEKTPKNAQLASIKSLKDLYV